MMIYLIAIMTHNLNCYFAFFFLTFEMLCSRQQTAAEQSEFLLLHQ